MGSDSKTDGSWGLSLEHATGFRFVQLRCWEALILASVMIGEEPLQSTSYNESAYALINLHDRQKSKALMTLLNQSNFLVREKGSKPSPCSHRRMKLSN
jgi:hypothetical protein